MTKPIALTAALLVATTATFAQSKIAFRQLAGKVEVAIDGRPFTTLYHGPEWSAPFLHPLRTAGGAIITRGYPLDKIEGDSSDHIWHHGLWWGHGDISGVDFWRDLGPDKTGRLVLISPVRTTADSMTAELALTKIDKSIVGRVTEEFRFSARDGLIFVDARITVRADRGMALKMGDTEEGSFAIRFGEEFREDRGASLMNSDRKSGTKNIWGKQARWVDYSATVKGAKAGAAILDHPSNPKYPTYWHARGYGLNAANPFGEHDFYGDKTRDGSVIVPKDGAMTFWYRVVIHSGIDANAIDRLADEFARERE